MLSAYHNTSPLLCKLVVVCRIDARVHNSCTRRATTIVLRDVDVQKAKWGSVAAQARSYDACHRKGDAQSQYGDADTQYVRRKGLRVASIRTSYSGAIVVKVGGCCVVW